MRKKPSGKFEDLTGMIFGYLKVENRAPNKPKGNGKFQTMWNCICLLCGGKTITSANKLKSGKKQSDGCDTSKRKSKAKTIDLTGLKFGMLLVESRAPNHIKPSGGTETMWNCICECGKRCIKSRQYLKHSKNPSCGCWASKRKSETHSIDLVGQIFGFLKVEKRIGTKRTTGGNPKALYLCTCLNCGNETKVTSDNLRSGSRVSCGCVKSLGEKKIKEYLLSNNVSFVSQYYFKDLFYATSRCSLPFDFALKDDKDNLLCLIEYQGKQHFYEQPSNPSYGKLERDVTDKLKREYCFAHNIPLEEIRYNEDIETKMNKIITTYVNSVPSSEREKV